MWYLAQDIHYLRKDSEMSALTFYATVQIVNFKTRCFTLNFIAGKIKVPSSLDVPNNVWLKKIDEYLESDIKSMLFFYFCFKCVKICCSLDNPNLYNEIKDNQVFGEYDNLF